MKSSFSINRARFRAHFPVVGLVLAVTAVLVSAVLLLNVWKGIPIGKLTRDPASITGVPIYTGFLSQIGVLLWSASTTICLFCASLLSTRQDKLRIKPFLLTSGLLSLILGLDDIFLLHERVFPDLGVAEEIVFASYAAFLFFYLFRFRAIILKTEYILLGMALLFFGVSITLDVFEPAGIDPYLWEDGAKLAGIVSWLAYFFRTGIFAIDRNFFQQEVGPRNLVAVQRR